MKKFPAYVGISLSEEDKQFLEKVALKSGLTLSALIRATLREFIERQKKEYEMMGEKV